MGGREGRDEEDGYEVTDGVARPATLSPMSESTIPQPGDKAPSFRAEASTGTVSLEDYRGKPLVLYFFPKADTGG